MAARVVYVPHPRSTDGKDWLIFRAEDATSGNVFKTDLFGETIAPVLEVSILFDALETLILV